MSRRFALVLMLAPQVWACDCGGMWPSVKQAWERAPYVFLGTVEVADPDEDSSQTIFVEQFVRIRVDEAFKGVPAGQTVELHQGASDCAAKFRTGERGVFYLYRRTGIWAVPACSRALGSADPAGDDLMFLRGLPKSAIGTRLSGEVELYEGSSTQAFQRVGGISNVKVMINGPRGLIRETVTNAAGAYEVFGLRSGRYSVSIQVPKGLKVKFPLISGSPPVHGNDAAVELAPNGGASVGFVLQADTRLSGHILDANGAPLTGVCIDLEPVEGGENGARFFNCSKRGGFFEMSMMPPGKYWLVAHDEIQLGPLKSKSTLYYPGVRDRQQATMISIEAGKYVEHLDIRLPSDEKRYTIKGRFQFADGAPVPTAAVTFTYPDHGYTESTSSGADGSFVLSVIAGMEGRLEGQVAVLEFLLKSCPEFKVRQRKRGLFRIMDASPIPLSSDSDHEGIKLELPSRSCESWPVGRR